MRIKVVPFLMLIASFFKVGCKTNTAQLEINIDWPTFMAEQDLVWDISRGRWENAAFNDNDLVGSTLVQTLPPFNWPFAGAILGSWISLAILGKGIGYKLVRLI